MSLDIVSTPTSPTTFRPAPLCSDNAICRPPLTSQTDTEIYNLLYVKILFCFPYLCQLKCHNNIFTFKTI